MGGKGGEGTQIVVGTYSIYSLRTVTFASCICLLLLLGVVFFVVTRNLPPSLPDFQYIAGVFLIYGLGRSSLLGRWFAL